jgi:hypothetical protein
MGKNIKRRTDITTRETQSPNPHSIYFHLYSFDQFCRCLLWNKLIREADISPIAPADISNLMVGRRLLETAKNNGARRSRKNVEEDHALISASALNIQKQESNSLSRWKRLVRHEQQIDFGRSN